MINYRIFLSYRNYIIEIIHENIYNTHNNYIVKINAYALITLS